MLESPDEFIVRDTIVIIETNAIFSGHLYKDFEYVSANFQLANPCLEACSRLIYEGSMMLDGVSYRLPPLPVRVPRS